VVSIDFFGIGKDANTNVLVKPEGSQLGSDTQNCSACSWVANKGSALDGGCWVITQKA